MTFIRSIFLSFFIICTGLTVLAQENIKLMCYNVLNFPLGDMPSREDTLAVVLHYYQPDLLMLQELKASFGLNAATNSLNELNLDEYRSSTFISQQSNGGGSLQHAIVYNNRIFGLAEEDVILTSVRDINYFKLFLRDAELGGEADTTFIHVFVTHLKASSGSANEQLRLESVNSFLPVLNALDDDANVIFAGDFNVYSSSEPAYSALINSSNSPRLEDPINSPGNWTSSSYPLKEIHTQSTRTSSVFGDGATGGVDDRFDFILCSENLLDMNAAVHYEEGTYEALGNSGQCHNQSVFGCAGSNGLPAAVTSAIYYQSDHFPVVMELSTNIELGVKNEIRQAYFKLFSPSSGILSLVNDQVLDNLEILDLSGRVVAQFGRIDRIGTHRFPVDLSPGIYVARGGNNTPGVKVFIH